MQPCKTLLRLRRLLALVAFAALLGCRSAIAGVWPLSGDLIAHDPTIIKDKDTWVVLITGSGAPIKTSADGRHWTSAGRLFNTERSWWLNYAAYMTQLDIWAPDIHEFRGRYWCYYSVSEFGRNNSAIGLMSCTSLSARDWRDDGFVIGSKSGVDAYNAIDPSLAVDASGEPWLVFGSWFSGIQLVRLDPATMKPVGKPQPLARRENGIEGPNLVYSNGYYYLFVSIDLCCRGVNSTYKIACGRSRHIAGPYLDREGKPMLEGASTVLDIGGPRWKGPGGQSVYRTEHGWIMAYHCYDADNQGSPTLMIRDLYWDAEGWPSLVPAQPGVTAPASTGAAPKPRS